MKIKSGDPTLVDVAKLAGVSIATVSRVLNESQKVKANTIQRVHSAMNELGYPYSQPSNTERNKLIVVVLPGLDNPFYAKIVQGIQASSKSHRYDTMIYLCKDVDQRYKKIIDALRMVHACGVIILSPVNHLEALQEINDYTPLVQCAEYNEDVSLPYVGVDDYSAAKNAVEYLISRGRKRIALINGPQKYKYSRQRHAGYWDALIQADLIPDPAFVFHVTEMGFDSAFSVARQLLLGNVHPDAILATSDISAAASVKAASDAGLRVPEDLAIIGFDNTFVSSISHPSVTAVNMPQFQLGYMASEVLVERISNPSGEQQNFLLNTELVIRGSV